MKLELQLESAVVAAGEELTGRVVVLEGGASRKLTLTVSFRERSPAFLVTAFTSSTVAREGELPTGSSVDFSFRIPEGATPSVRGKHGELFWEVEAVSDEPGLDTHVRRRIEIVPAEPH